jgi:4-hydroxybenzoate polyprenyltransferase
MAVSLVGLGASGIALGLFNAWTLPLAALCIVGLATYTFFKRRWWAGPFYNAWIVAGLFVIAYLAGGGRIAGFFQPAIGCAAAAVFFGYANFVLTGYYKDISADRATGYDTLPVHFGMRRAAFVSDGFAAVTVASAGAGLWITLDGNAFSMLGSIGFGIAGSIAVLIGQIRLHRLRSEAEAHAAIAPVVHAYLLLLAALATAQRPGWTIPLLAGYGAFVLVLRHRPMQAQI